MMPATISPAQARKLIDAGALLVDVREADEYARERIPGAKLMPLSKIAGGEPDVGDASTVIFHCRTGGRTAAAIEHLRPVGDVEAYILDGGITAWKQAGLPTVVDKRQPIEILRQMQLVAGTMALTGVALGTFVDPAFYALSGLVGAGLVFAGVTGVCPMVNLLKRMPWNRETVAAPATPAKA